MKLFAGKVPPVGEDFGGGPSANCGTGGEMVGLGVFCGKSFTHVGSITKAAVIERTIEIIHGWIIPARLGVPDEYQELAALRLRVG